MPTIKHGSGLADLVFTLRFIKKESLRANLKIQEIDSNITDHYNSTTQPNVGQMNERLSNVFGNSTQKVFTRIPLFHNRSVQEGQTNPSQ